VRRAHTADEVLVLKRHDAQKRALTGAIAADDADLRARKEREPDVLEYLALVVRLAEVLNREDVLFSHALRSVLVLCQSGRLSWVYAISGGPLRQREAARLLAKGAGPRMEQHLQRFSE